MPKDKLTRANELADRLAELLGNELVSVVAYGESIRDGYAQGHADLRIILIVTDASSSHLRPIEPAIADWVKHRAAPPLIFSQVEWEDSTDVFPMEVEDMREAHRILKGIDPFEGLTTTSQDLRLQLEREVRGKLLQLRSEYAAVAPDGKALTRLLLDSVVTFFVIMRGLVRLVGGTPKARPEELVQQAAEAADLDPTAFQWVVDKISGKTVQALKPYDPIGARYVDEIEKMAAYVDRHDGGGETSPAQNDQAQMSRSDTARTEK